MKSITRSLFILSMLTTFLWSCEKDENIIYFEGSTAPVLTTTVTGASLPLSYVNRDLTALKLSWTNPDYRFTTGISSQNVTYLVEIDTAGANFTNPKRQTVQVSQGLNVTFTQGQFNDFLLNQMLLDSTKTHNIEIRVKATLNAGSVPISSNILRYTVKPFAIPPKVDPPTTGKLFITGSATPASWQCGCGEAELASQRFNRISNTLYELPSITLTGGGSYLFLPQYGSWSAKFGFTGGGNANNVDGDDFRFGGNDIKAPAATGLYKIIVNFATGKFQVIKI